MKGFIRSVGIGLFISLLIGLALGWGWLIADAREVLTK